MEVMSARKNRAREGLSGGRFLLHAPFQVQEIGSSLLNPFLKFASLFYYDCSTDHKLKYHYFLFTYLFMLKSNLTTFRHKYNVRVEH